MSRNIWRQCGGAAFALSSVLVLGVVLWLRYGLLEADALPRECGGSLAEGLAGWCGVKWALVQSFMQQRIGWLALLLGALAFVSGRRVLAWVGWWTGLAGLVLYSFDPAAVGALLALLCLVRARPEQGGQPDRETGQQPGNGLGVGRLA